MAIANTGTLVFNSSKIHLSKEDTTRLLRDPEFIQTLVRKTDLTEVKSVEFIFEETIQRRYLVDSSPSGPFLKVLDLWTPYLEIYIRA